MDGPADDSSDERSTSFKRDEERHGNGRRGAINAELRDLLPPLHSWRSTSRRDPFTKSLRLTAPRRIDRCLEGITVPTVVDSLIGYPGGGGRQHESNIRNARD